MTTLTDGPGRAATLHVFAQDGGWHWGITVPRENGGGFRVVAYNTGAFAQESDAAADGCRTLDLMKKMPA
jgi:hypothetical protein